MSLFSVVMPTYNRAPFLQRTLESVLAQECRDFEIIVVDDGSTDATCQVLGSFGDKIRLFHQKNRGPGAARNLGAANARGDYLAFIDSDDLWFPWTLASYAQILEHNAWPTLVAGTLRYFYDEAELGHVAREPVVAESFADYFAASGRGRYCGTCQMLVRRDALLEVGGFVEERVNAEDHDLVMRLGTAPGFVYATAPAMIGYRQHPEAVTRDLSKTFTGVVHMLDMERAGNYPGGKDRRRERRRILAQHVRPLTLALLLQHEHQKAWALYRQTFGWHVALGKFPFLAGFFLKAVPGIRLS
jgi:glycosyltransferase involved in cell wall biosynthesis